MEENRSKWMRGGLKWSPLKILESSCRSMAISDVFSTVGHESKPPRELSESLARCSKCLTNVIIQRSGHEVQHCSDDIHTQ